MNDTMHGTITGLRDRGFGFIAPDGGTAGDLFFHRTAVADGGFDALRVEQRVSFEQGPDPRDPTRQRARCVAPWPPTTAAEGAPPVDGTAVQGSVQTPSLP